MTTVTTDTQEFVEQYVFKINGDINHASLNEVNAEYPPDTACVSSKTAYIAHECFGCFESAVMEYLEDDETENVAEYSVEITPFLRDAVVGLIDCFGITSYEYDDERAVIYFDDLEILKEFLTVYSDTVTEFLEECEDESEG